MSSISDQTLKPDICVMELMTESVEVVSPIIAIICAMTVLGLTCRTPADVSCL